MKSQEAHDCQDFQWVPHHTIKFFEVGDDHQKPTFIQLYKPETEVSGLNNLFFGGDLEVLKIFILLSKFLTLHYIFIALPIRKTYLQIVDPNLPCFLTRTNLPF